MDELNRKINKLVKEKKLTISYIELPDRTRKNEHI